MTASYDRNTFTITMQLNSDEAGYLGRVVRDEGAQAVQDRLQSWLDSTINKYVQLDSDSIRQALAGASRQQLVAVKGLLGIK